MGSNMNRSRASTLKDAGPEMGELQNHLQVLERSGMAAEEGYRTEALQTNLETLHRLRQSLLEDSTTPTKKDTFRYLNGFQIIISILSAVCQHHAKQTFSNEEHMSLFSSIIQAIFGVITAALENHNGNRRFFRQRIEQGGWNAVKLSLEPIIIGMAGKEKEHETSTINRLFGCLLASALEDESMTDFFSILTGKLDNVTDVQQQWSRQESGSQQSDTRDDTDLISKGEISAQMSLIAEYSNNKLGPFSIVRNEDALLVLFQLWGVLEDQLPQLHSQPRYDAIVVGVPVVLNHVVGLSTRNLAALHGTNLFRSVLEYLQEAIVSSSHISQLLPLSKALLGFGIASMDDAHSLFYHARSSALIASLLLSSSQCSRSPSFVHFDLSLNGYASIELPGIGKAFPPVSPSGGYTLSLWFQMVHFDPHAHTTIFGAFDASQTCFVLVYLEKDTHNLILQTSVTSSRPSVRFKSISFKPGRWYHVVITHRRPKTTSSARASLFIDGEFVEQVKSQYPATPPPIKHNSLGIDSSSLQRKTHAIQAFFGTPQDLATHLGAGLVHTQWRFASAHVFTEILSDDLIAVYYQLGSRYTGNYQDCLGSFQTYHASAALNLRNESLHPGREEKSDIISAIRSKAGALLPESKILLNISARLILDDNDQNNIDAAPLLRFISKASIKNLNSITRGGRNALAINGAVPLINEALLHSYGFAVLTGDPIVVIPQSLDDAAWRIGGCAAVCLALLEAANSSDEIVRALKILFASVKENWRNSETMERENGFGILSNLLDAKLSLTIRRSDNPNAYSHSSSSATKADPGLALTVLAEILKFLGYRIDKPEESVINNALAYRILLVDMEFWRLAEWDVQKLYYEQFVVFGLSSKYHHFNAKRLSRMRMIKKWLEALRGEAFTERTFSYFLQAFKSFLNDSLSADSMRSLSLYITYAIHKPKPLSILPSRGKSIRSTTDLLSRRKDVGDSVTHQSTATHDENSTLTQSRVAFRILEMYTALLCNKNDLANIKRFARTVTNKWLLHLLADDESTVVTLAAKILARLLVISGPLYMQKFIEKTGGIVVMRHRLKRWWKIPSIWPICFAILFGIDVAILDFSRNFDLFGLLEMFASGDKITVKCPEMLSVLTAMLGQGLKIVTRDQADPDSPLPEKSNGRFSSSTRSPAATTPTRQRSRTMEINVYPTITAPASKDQLEESVSTLRTVTRFLADVHSKYTAFRDFTIASLYVQELFHVLFPIVVSANAVSPETELNSRDSALTFKGSDVIMRPMSSNSTTNVSVVRTSNAEYVQTSSASRAQPLTRMASYVLVSSDSSHGSPTARKLHPVVSPRRMKAASNLNSTIVEELLELIVGVYTDQIFSRKDFPGLGLFMRVPPGFQEHQAYFETFILRNTLTHLGNSIKLNQKLLWEPRVLTNLARFAMHLSEAIYEGWFISGADDAIEFLATILEYLQLPGVSTVKGVRLCSHLVSNIRIVLLRIVLLKLAELDELHSGAETVSFLNRLAYWQSVLFPAHESQEVFVRLFCYLVYNRLCSFNEEVQIAAADLWRMLLVQNFDDINGILKQVSPEVSSPLIEGFKKIVEIDNESFLHWVRENRSDLDTIISIPLSKSWEVFVVEEDHRTEETAKARIVKRREKLKVWATESANNEGVLGRHETGTDHWRSNIYAAEHLKRQRAMQDQQDGILFNASKWARMSRGLRRPCGLFEEKSTPQWQLDQTEGRNRMRMRLIADKDTHVHDYQPKRSKSQGPIRQRRSTSSRNQTVINDIPPLPKPLQSCEIPKTPNSEATVPDESVEGAASDDEVEDDFELVDDPRDKSEEYEDKNRKVMRSLQRGDQVEHVHNVSQIIGLEAMEGLLILGKGYLYLLDGLFQRSDGEVVNVWQAPQEERDPYLQMISGREAGNRPSSSMRADYETRNWRWDDVLNISKRRFLFRDVAIELFFVDGRSYLLTSNTPLLRNELYQKLMSKASSAVERASAALAEDLWRIESIRSPIDENQTFGSRFTSVFIQNASNSATRKWIKGETSNFDYLMRVNTLAGRTFNDLTQYPVFPWVLADYSSEELDLSDPRSYRDLSKPMGCQNQGRQAEFRNRYQSFAEMGDENSPPFHYGTHYSSAMIVTSYLIRLQPFVHSYLLLQGGNFDHPDRLFYSLDKAWTSASRDNMTDVRELIPEFYYLPEFLVNKNRYDFGERQGDGGRIDTVELPPWAKGDPKIFIAKHREALESDYVSQHLHQWIDLIFGHKQRGEAALEATNVFHHLSYHGAKDLDTIEDPMERLATIGIIHNFGQTPHQVFHRAHPIREEAKNKVKRLDAGAEGLTRLPFPVLETGDRISSLQYSQKHDRLICSGPFRVNIGPAYDKFMEWGFIDSSVRFFASDSKKMMGLFEHVHQTQLSYVVFADSKTLVTAGSDCTISIWTVITAANSVDLQPKVTLFGHRAAVTMLAVSRSFSALLSASSDGQVLLWDLNRLELVRRLTTGKPVECARINDVTGTIVLCRGSAISLWTLNGDLILEQDVHVEGDDIISACAFYEGSGNEYLERNLIFTGHRKGVVNVWNIAISGGAFTLEHVKRMHHLDHAGYNIGATIAAILPMAQKVYTGDDDGRVYEWDCIQRQ